MTRASAKRGKAGAETGPRTHGEVVLLRRGNGQRIRRQPRGTRTTRVIATTYTTYTTITWTTITWSRTRPFLTPSRVELVGHVDLTPLTRRDGKERFGGRC